MLGELYYLNASLPSLAADQRAPFSADEFLFLCRGHLSDADFDMLQASRLWEGHAPDDSAAAPPAAAPASDLWQRWLAFERGLRRRLAILRAGQLDWDDGADTEPSPMPADDSTTIRRSAEDAFEEDSPLTAETDLFHARWRFLDDLDRDRFMTLENLVAYYLKLQLLEQRAEVSEERGQQTLADLRRIVETELPDAGFFAATTTTTASAS